MHSSIYEITLQLRAPRARLRFLSRALRAQNSQSSERFTFAQFVNGLGASLAETAGLLKPSSIHNVLDEQLLNQCAIATLENDDADGEIVACAESGATETETFFYRLIARLNPEPPMKHVRLLTPHGRSTSEVLGLGH